MIHHTQGRKKTFTLIEVLIALMVFGIGFIVLMRAVVFFLTTGDDMKKRAEATLLAKEAADIIYNQRDTNLRRGVTRKCAEIATASLGAGGALLDGDACNMLFAPGSSFIVGYNPATKIYKIDKYSGGDTNVLYPAVLDASGKKILTPFVHAANATMSIHPYKRTVSFSAATLRDNVLNTDHILKMTVTVQYVANNPDRTVVLESYLAAGGKE